MSIKRRLLLSLLISLLGISVIFIAATYAVERAVIEHRQDQRLRQIAQDIPPKLKPADLRSINVKLFHGRDDFLLQIWQADREIYRSTIDRGRPRSSLSGFGIQTVNGERWKLYVRHAGGYTIQVSQSLEERSALARERAMHLILPLILLISVIALCTPLGVSAGLKSLRRISSELDSRNLDRLIPLDPRGEPAEILPVVEAINTLLGRLGKAAGAQQQFLTDASHELRTPLAGLQLQVKMIEQAGDAETRGEALTAVMASVKRTGRLVDQLLTTSRLDVDALVAEPKTVSLNMVVRDAMVRLEPIAVAKRMDIGLIRDDEVTIRGSGDEMLLLILNLIDNAIRYTPEDGQVDVSIQGAAETAILVVEDSGPGIPPPERARAFDRFVRGRGHAVAGSGLGLAIVKRISDRHGASVTLGDSATLGGLAVTTTFPHPSSQPH